MRESGSVLQFDPLSQGLFIIQRLDKLPITITRIGEGTFDGGDSHFRLYFLKVDKNTHEVTNEGVNQLKIFYTLGQIYRIILKCQNH